MMAITEQVIDEMMEVIIREIHPERIILFGSRARGEEKMASDIDLLVVEKESFGMGHSRREEIARIRRILSQFRIPKDILVYSTDEIAKWQHAMNHIISHILREGRVLYERP